MPYTDTYNVAPSSTGLTAPLSLGSDFIDAARALPHAIKHKDTAYITELSVRLLVIPIGIISCIERIVALGIELFQKLSNFALILQASIMGLVFVSVELILETYRFLRILSFAKKIQAPYRSS